MTDLPAETCEFCSFAEAVVLDDGPSVQCRRFPPAVIVTADEPLVAWPTVMASDWCGEFKR